MDQCERVSGRVSDGPRSEMTAVEIDRRTALKTTASGALGVSVAGCLDVYGVTGSSETDDPIKIGVLAPRPDQDPTGRSMWIGAQIAAHDLNDGTIGDEHGIHGRDVEVVVGDTKSSPLEARRQYHRLVLDRKVDATVGVYNSEVLNHLVEDIADQRTIHITSGATSESATEAIKEEYDRYKYHFRTMLNSTQLMENQIQFAAEFFPEIGWDSVGVITEDYQWADDILEPLSGGIQGTGIEVVYSDQYPAETDDFGSIYEEIESQGADAMFVAMAHTGDDAIIDWATYQPALGFSGIHVPMQIPQYYELVGGACEYGISTTSAVPGVDLSDRTQPFFESFREEAGFDPMYTGYYTYDAVSAYGLAARKASDPEDEDEIVTELEALEFESTTGSFEFQSDDDGDDDDYSPHDSPWTMDNDYVGTISFQWQEDENGNGVQEVIWPDEYQTGEYVDPPWI